MRTKTKPRRAASSDAELAGAEAQQMEAARDHAAARATYDDARANRDAQAMAEAKNLVESTKELLDEAAGCVAEVHARIDEAKRAQDAELFLDRAEAVALALAAECDTVEKCRAKLAETILSLGARIREARGMRNVYRQQLLALDRRYAGELDVAIEARGKVRLGRVLDARPGFEWGDNRDLGELAGDRDRPLWPIIDALADSLQERRARLPNRGVVI
jgi:hypothetical protein